MFASPDIVLNRSVTTANRAEPAAWPSLLSYSFCANLKSWHVVEEGTDVPISAFLLGLSFLDVLVGFGSLGSSGCCGGLTGSG